MHYEEVRNHAQELNSIILQMRRAEKDYMLRDIVSDSYYKTGESKQIHKFETFYKSGLEKLAQLDSASLANGDSLKMSKELFKVYHEKFLAIAELYKSKGYKDWGHEGEMRQAIHSIENGNTRYDTTLMLTLRRHEKDFLLRRNVSDYRKFEEKLAKFKAKLEHTADQPMMKALERYGEEMHAIVELEEAIGLTENDGVKGEMRHAINKLEPMILRIDAAINREVEQLVSNVYLICVSLFVFQVAIGVMLALAFSKSITNTVVSIKDRILTLSQGKFPAKLQVNTADEMGDTSLALNNLIDRIHTASDFASQIGEGKLEISYDNNFDNDVLANSLQGMQRKLVEAANENQRRSWITSGLASFADIMRTQDNDLRKLCQTLISQLVKYMEGNQGQLYIVKTEEGTDTYLELMSTYAWGRNKFVENRVSQGDGLIGQAWLEKQSTLLTEVPKNFIRITSGLGEAEPNCIAIVPLKYNDEVFGIVEVASFKQIQSYQLEFLEKVGELFASTIASAQVSERTKRLLEASQQQAEELRAQEEEMRQNMEELTATQEEMSRKDAEISSYIETINKGFVVVELNTDGMIMSANENFLSAVGYTSQEIQRKFHRDLIDAEAFVSSDYKVFWSNLRKGLSQRHQFTYVRRNGKHFSIIQQFTPVTGKGGDVTKIVSVGSERV